jgi:UDP-N-acetylmuramyl pentapeptide phosphotransferase/UDP-N-acetylglucosamine-1-phosphate transferase
MSHLVTSAVVACAMGALLTWPLLGILRRARVLDVPGTRSSHDSPTPRGGGVAVVFAICVGSLIVQRDLATATIVGTILLLGFIGFYEDLLGASQLIRAAAQTAVVAVAVVSLLRGHAPQAHWVAVAAVTLAVVSYTNAFNFMDGINGISCIQAILVAVTYLAFGIQAHDRVLQVGAVALLGACVAFLPWNAPRARLFLGDVGSYALGGMVGLLAIRAFTAGLPAIAVLAPVGLYLADTCVTFIRRVLRGEPWHLPHRSHTYQQLTDCRLTHMQVDGIVAAVIGSCCLLAWLSMDASLLSQSVLGLMICVILGGYLVLPWLLRTHISAGAALSVD